MTENEFNDAVSRNAQRLFVIAFSYLKSRDDAEDVLQNTFLKLWNSSKSFNDDSHIDKWLNKVCINDCKSVFRMAFRKNISFDEISELSSSDKYFNLDLFNAISSLGKKERLCIVLFYYDDMSINDISKMLDIKASTVKSILHRSRQKLKQMLGDEWINE